MPPVDFNVSDEDFLQQEPPVVDPTDQLSQAELDAQVRLQQEKDDAEAAANLAAANPAPIPQPGDADYVEPTEPVLKSGDEGYVEPAAVLKEGDEGYVSPAPAPAVVEKTPEELAADKEAAAQAALGTPPPAIDYEAAFKNMMKPLRANGKDIELRDPEELIKLAQQGANFTQKMQQLAPHRKALMMLQNNGIDESRLSFLIDLDKKNPEAIKQLIKDAGINPLDIDPDVAPAYQSGNHRVSDEEANFQSALDNMTSSDEGRATLQVINSTWDQASKDMLWKNPEIMSIMHEAKQSGVYDVIATEVERRRILGQLPVGMSFVQAYKTVGDQMVAEKPAPVQTAPVPVATRVAAPKPDANNAKAQAAAATRTTQRQAKVLVNPLAMSDDEFLKQFQNRL
jgi:hypothetical protein